MDETRVDQWLWAVRVYRTRSTASEACRGGKVRVNGRGAKPATPVRVGDRVEARIGDVLRDLEVVRPIDKRVGASTALECLVDHSPPAPRRERVPRPFQRLPGTGRPTKRDRRLTDRFRER